MVRLRSPYPVLRQAQHGSKHGEQRRTKRMSMSRRRRHA